MAGLEPIFVNRRVQLAYFDEVLSALDQGDRRHTALLGLRRIGKTMLLDEVRRRHPTHCIPRLPVDSIVGTPDNFAFELMAAVLAAACSARGMAKHVTTQPSSIMAAAALLSDRLIPAVEELLDIASRGTYLQLLPRVFLFPAALSDALDMPILLVLDEFQDLQRLRNFLGTENLLPALREALDRQGKVAFAIAGSIVTMMRRILHEGNNPLFTRFRELELPPFEEADTQGLAAGLWERGGMEWTQDATQRLHVLTQGLPFYVHTLALAAADLARSEAGRVAGYHVDAAFETQLLDRNSTLCIYCQYLYAQAIGDVRGENVPDALLRHLATREGVSRAELARVLGRAVRGGQVHRVMRELIDIDILTDVDGGLFYVDPLLPLWVALERERRDPAAVLSAPGARKKVLESQAERLRALQDAIGETFEKRVHNALRQFRGQDVPGRVLGAAERVTLPAISEVRDVELPDPEGHFSGKAGSVEIDAIATGSATWAVECRYRAGGTTAAQVERFLRACRFYETETGQVIGGRWYVSQTGFRSDARDKCLQEGVYTSTTRDLRQLERFLSR